MYSTSVYIEGQRLDLFDDETISIVSSVQNIEDISRIFNDFSQSFTVPASPNNNRIFKHWYNFNINNGFDARVRHNAHIDINYTNFKSGTIRLESCELENNKPVHYSLTFFGHLIDLKQVISDDYLSELDFSEYDIDYTAQNILHGLRTGFNDENYIFPLIGTRRQWFYNSSISENTFQERLSNIAWNNSTETHGIEFSSLRPAISINVIIEKIESEYDISFSRDFLFTEPFDNLFLWLANQDSEDSLINNYIVTEYLPRGSRVIFPGAFLPSEATGVFQPSLGSYNNTTGVYSPTSNGSPNMRVVEVDAITTDNVIYTLQLMNGSEVVKEDSGNGNVNFSHTFPQGVDEGSSLYIRILTSTNKTIDFLEWRVKELSEDTVLYQIKTDFDISGSVAKLRDFMPKIKIIDFLRSIIKKYNLVVVPKSRTDFYINTLDNWYAEGDVYDISPFVDTSKITTKRSKIFKDISFGFKEPQTILAKQFEKTNNTAYGDLETKLKNSDGTSLDGEGFEINLDFEQMVYERLLNTFNDSITNIVYGLSLDSSLGETLPEAHIFYGIKNNVSVNPLSFVDDTGNNININTNAWMPSHANSNQSEYSTVFGSEINEHTGSTINNSLFKLYYRDYITDSFSIKRRNILLESILPIWLITKLKLNDRLVINGDRFIINQMTIEATSQKVKMDLLNDIYNSDSDLEIKEETSVNPTQDNTEVFAPRSFSISSIGSTSQFTACGLTPDITGYFDGNEQYPILGNVIYEDSAGTIIYDGQNRYYKIDSENIIWISTEGIVLDVFFCSQSNGGGGNQ